MSRSRPVKRLLAGGFLVALLALLASGAAGGGSEDRYLVRALFDNASTVIPGEDVRIAGVPVGVIESLDVTEDQKAVVVLQIDNRDFTPFKSDATCKIRPQSLIGEKFVECEPGSSSAPALERIEDGPGEGERLLRISQTSSTVDPDLVLDVMRLPYRQRLGILLTEFGTGLAGRSEELNRVIHRANPALRETDRVLETLARQNRVVARLAENSDRVLAPLARERRRVSDWIEQANATGEATAERREDLRRAVKRLPALLRELRPLMADLEDLSNGATPVVSDVGDAAPELTRAISSLGPLADAGRESLPSLGEALERGRPAVLRARPLIRDLGELGRQAAPTSIDLDELTASLDRAGGLERLTDYLHYAGLSLNGFDSIGHYVRGGLVPNTCAEYVLQPTSGCNANFFDLTVPGASVNARSSAAPDDQAPTEDLIVPAEESGEARAHDYEPVLDYLLGPEE